MSYTRSLDVHSFRSSGLGHQSIKQWDPADLLSGLPPALLSVSSELLIRIWDDEVEVQYKYDTFMSKTYEIKDGRIMFGAKKVKLSEASIMIGIKYIVEDLRGMTEPLD